MDERIWKWILEHLDNQILLSVVQDSGIHIPGFRRVTVGVIKQVKKKLITDMVKGKNLIKIKSLFNYLEENDHDGVRHIEWETLKNKLESGYLDPCQTFAYLLSSDVETHREKAYQLFEKISTNKLDKLAAQFKEMEKKSENQQTMANKNQNLLEKRWRKSEEKNRELKAQIEKERSRHQQMKNELNGEIKNLKQELIKLGQEVGRLNHEKEDFIKKNQELKTANRNLQEKLAQKEKTLTVLMTKEHGQNDNSGKRKIAMIGDPKNQMILKAPLYHFHIFNPSDLQTGNEEVELLDCDEVWLLTYRTPLAQQLYVKKRVDKQKLIEFHSYLEIRNHIRERVSQ